ncbi:MAG: hypothetical protein A3F74_00305 [Betaproteobacteria bacterium RIFCSPLOWO2_12_FULL_62_58]|nr:MAG: hypothetical protein A3F74_00305 [Betaproteobacteria bacterium RIFCSPLOWO2_12_FULL_62_58]
MRAAAGEKGHLLSALRREAAAAAEGAARYFSPRSNSLLRFTALTMLMWPVQRQRLAARPW